MSFWKNTEIKKTRKEHRCEFCLRMVPKASAITYCRGKWEGEFQSYYLCSRCDEYIDRYCTDLSDGFSPGDFMEHVLNESAPCPKCGKYEWREYNWDDEMMFLSLECDNCDHKWVEDYSMTKEGER